MIASRIETNLRREQLLVLRKTVALSIPINMMLGLCALALATYYDNGKTGAAWFFFSTLANISRLVACRLPLEDMPPNSEPNETRRFAVVTERQLLLHTVLASLSGITWACVPALCDWYTSPQTLFYALIVCGITAGAVTYGYSFASVPTAFITPTLLSSAYFLWNPESLDRIVIAATVGLYLFALIRGARVNQGLFRNDSRQRIEAVIMSTRLEKSTKQALDLAKKTAELVGLDKLTGLLNRRGFTDHASELFTADGDKVMFMLDLDGFKAVNDAFGHQAGDRVLAEAAARIEEIIGTAGFASRLGGDEFTIVLTDSATTESFKFFAKKLIAGISRPYPGIEPLSLGVSIGIYTGGGTTLDDALMYSDIALYAAKENGRNQYRVFDADLRAKIEMRRDVERGLLGALARHELEVWYQPVVDVETGAVVSLEALLRWNHPKLGWISPPLIVAAAAAIGRAQDLMRFIFTEAAETIGSISDPRIRVAVNVSPRELTQIDVEAIITEVFVAQRVALTSLELEVTEDATIEQANVQQRLNSLSDQGVKLAIDDFGTGYSSLATLQELQIGRLKIDKSFVTGTRMGTTKSSLVEAIVGLSHALKFEIVAEGVETQEDLRNIRELGCTYAQGYYFSKAMPRSDALALIIDPAKTRHLTAGI